MDGEAEKDASVPGPSTPASGCWQVAAKEELVDGVARGATKTLNAWPMGAFRHRPFTWLSKQPIFSLELSAISLLGQSTWTAGFNGAIIAIDLCVCVCERFQLRPTTDSDLRTATFCITLCLTCSFDSEFQPLCSSQENQKTHGFNGELQPCK